MKRSLLVSSIAVVSTLTSFAQTNALPQSGNVGIGTTLPASDLNAYNSVPLTLGGALVDTSPGSTGTSCSITQVFQQNSWNSPVGAIQVRGNLYHTWRTEMAFRVRNGENSLIEPLVLNALGNVGIGTTNPSAPLQVRVVDNDSLAVFSNWNNAVALQTLLDGQNLDGYNYGGGENRLLLQPLAGSVGIGTTAPSSPLHVSGAGNANTGTIRLDSGNPFTSITSRQFDIATEQEGFTTFANAYNATNNFLSIGGGLDEFNAATSISFYTGSSISQRTGTIRMLINSFGNVGIGTTNPTHKLAVNGTIKAREVIVETTDWSDYVLADDYALQPLAEVEAHIKANKHLPGIPSAAQVATEGVSVGDLQAKLLAKIEELTLHQIAQEKLLTAQATALSSQADELNSLRSEVRTLRERVGE